MLTRLSPQKRMEARDRHYKVSRTGYFPVPSTKRRADKKAQAECGPRAAERLRRFLSFCLALDYSAWDLTPDRLTLNEVCFWVTIFIVVSGNDHTSSEVLDRETYLPARALGVPNTAVIANLWMFTVRMRNWTTGSSESASNLIFFESRSGLRAVAAKLVLDRHLLDLVVPASAADLKRRMQMRLRWVQAESFIELRENGYYHLTHSGQHTLAVDEGRLDPAFTRRNSEGSAELRRAQTKRHCRKAAAFVNKLVRDRYTEEPRGF